MAENKQKEDYYFFLCPNCQKLATYWLEVYSVTNFVTYKSFPQPEAADEYLSTNEGEEEVLYVSRCPLCRKEFYSAFGNIFVIKINKKNLEIEPVGVYWENRKSKLNALKNKIIDNFLNLIGEFK